MEQAFQTIARNALKQVGLWQLLASLCDDWPLTQALPGFLILTLLS